MPLPCRYAGYPLLLQAIALPGEDGPGSAATPQQAQHAQQQAQQHFLSAEAAPQLQAATELCWLTCAASRLNGDELTRAGGLHLLGHLLSRCIAGLDWAGRGQGPGGHARCPRELHVFLPIGTVY